MQSAVSVDLKHLRLLGYRLYRVSQILWCSADVDQMHQQAEFELDPACDWQPVELLQSRCHVIRQAEVEYQRSCHVLDSL